MTHKCNLCEKPMLAVDDIEIKGIRELEGTKVRGWRCKCGNEHCSSDDIDVLVEYYKILRSGVKVTLFKSGNSWAIRLPASLVHALHLKPKSGFSLKLIGETIVLKPIS